MKVIGIIAEYNPFHNGHKYQIEEVKRRTNADYVVIAMSGNFVQRGVPALCDKYSRTKMALSCGADLVLELPAIWATASAELFAKGGVSLFSNTGVVNHLGFGAETDNLDLLKQIAFVLSEEPAIYKNALSSYLKNGKNFPTARKLALMELFSNEHGATSFPSHNTMSSASNSDIVFRQTELSAFSAVSSAQLEEILNSPNNILGIEYLKAIYRQEKHTHPEIKYKEQLREISDSTFWNKETCFFTTPIFQSLTPVLIQRKGAGYHEKSMDILHPSATAIRNLLFSSSINDNNQHIFSQSNTNSDLSQNKQIGMCHTTFSKETLNHFNINNLTSGIPEETLFILCQLIENHALLQENDISSILGYRLLSLKKEGYASFADCSVDLSNKIVKNLRNYTNFTDFCELLKSKELTHTRISRTLLHILLDIKQNDYAYAEELGIVPYLRILGFRKDSTKLLSAIKKEATVPLITKVADAASILSSDAYAIFEKDLFASDIYYQLLSQKTEQKPMNEFTHPIMMI